MQAPPQSGTIALVDDEKNIRETVGLALRREGYTVEGYADGLAAWEAFERELPDLVILDILMPRLDGLELCRRLRARSEALPILFLTSKDEEFDRVLGLELGADDYLVKPFSLRELVARVRVLFRRLALARAGRAERSANGTGTEGTIEAGPLTLDLDRHEARWAETPLGLTVTEFRVLRALARRPGHVKTRTQLLDEAYPDDAYVAERTVDSHIKRLRRKIERAVAASGRAGDGDPIETVYGLGYRFRS
ncbi:MAG: response regulator transcription factor [Acidobacteriota bacterium]